MLLLLAIIAVCCSLFFYVQAFKSGMCQKRWAVAGFIFGPVVLPLFSVQRQMKLRKFTGANSVRLNV